MYKHHPDGSYIFSPDGALQWANRNDITDTVLKTLKEIYCGIVTYNKVDPGHVMCNDYVLDQVFIRYSRDIFGEYRLNSKIEYLRKVGALTETQQKNLMEFSQYGLKIDSREPYVHRKAAYLLYWLSVLKPRLFQNFSFWNSCL
jgi:hypothetical protein